MVESPFKSKDYKLVIAGLDNAGKTSSLIALRQKYNFYEKVKKLKPTIKVDYSTFKFLDNNIFFWDMGGQEKYRKIYVKDPIYFSETDYLYFIIDIQDELKFEDAVNYLHTLLDIYRDLEYSNEIVVCFDKYDPKFKHNKEYNDRVEMIKKLILEQNKDMKFKFFNMSYYDIALISKAFSHALNQLLNMEQINNELKQIVDNIGCYHAILYTHNGIIISDYYKEIMDSRDFDEIITARISDNLEFFQRLKDENVEIDDRLAIFHDAANYVKRYSILLDNENHFFYLGISTPLDKINEIKIKLTEFKDILESSFT
jgi:small GTP-binding protein